MIPKTKTIYFCFYVLFFDFSNASEIDSSIKVVNGKKCLTSELCQKNGTSLTSFEAIKKKIDIVDNNAFDMCTKVKSISLFSNFITQLDSNLFMYNVQLEELNMGCNRISFIPPGLFTPLKNLKNLILNANPLTTIKPILDAGLHRLEWLEIKSIGIFAEDLDVKKLRKYLRNLKKIGINYNYIGCNFSETMANEFIVNKLASGCETLDYKECFSIKEIEAMRDSMKMSQALREGILAEQNELITNLTKNLITEQNNTKLEIDNLNSKNRNMTLFVYTVLGALVLFLLLLIAFVVALSANMYQLRKLEVDLARKAKELEDYAYYERLD